MKETYGMTQNKMVRPDIGRHKKERKEEQEIEN
jgi:hypothetical protein